MIPTELGALIKRLGASVEALAALGAVLSEKLGHTRVHPELRQSVAAVTEALLDKEALEHLSDQELLFLLGTVQSAFRQSGHLLEHPAEAPGWRYSDSVVLRAQGQGGVAVPGLIAEVWAPYLPGLIESLRSPNALFLDVGVGVATISIAMCRAWPGLGAVGIDPFEPALEIARESVIAAGMVDRIELRAGLVEELKDRERFDLAWLPTFFISRGILDQAIGNVSQSLRPGAWLLMGINPASADPLLTALDNLRTLRFGGCVLEVPGAITRLEDAGLEQVIAMPDELPVPVRIVAGRRRPATR
jgi:precorrin-6B methylase 2